MLWRGGCSGRWQRSRAACPRGDGRGTWAGRQQQGTHGRQLLSAPHGQATKDKFMGPGAALRAEHTGALWSWVRQCRAASGSGTTTLCCSGPPLLAGCCRRLPGLISVAHCFVAKKSEKPLGVLQNGPMESNSHRELSSSAKWKLTIILPFFPARVLNINQISCNPF